jgi:hypothetical protein
MGDDTVEETTPPTLPCDHLTCNTMSNFDNRESANDGMGIAWALAALAILALMLTNGRYGYFRDEFYYLAASDHLALGYVDFAPLMAWFTHASRFVFGDSLHAIRLLPAVAFGAECPPLCLCRAWLPHRWFSRFFRQPGLFPTWKGSASSQLRRKPTCEAFCRNTSRTNSMARDGRDRGRRL